jgi:hypothetical protein
VGQLFWDTNKDREHSGTVPSVDELTITRRDGSSVLI